MIPALLALADGSIFRGLSIGVPGEAVGEVVFNTSMTGYQEILTDPSYAQQLITLTYPHIGNTGTNSEDIESNRIWGAGLIVREVPLLASSWRSQQSLTDYLQQASLVALADIDTRRLTRHIRTCGAQAGCILAATEVRGELDEAHALERARAFPGLVGMDLAREVSRRDIRSWQEGSWQQGSWHLDSGYAESASSTEFHVVAYDFGVKYNILRLLVDRGCRLTLVPAQTPAEAVFEMAPDGVFLSNGPGDPEPCDYAISAIKTLCDANVPIFGICLGYQLLALASGARGLKMPHGHHGANHPVQDLRDQKVVITSQNHGFAIDVESLPNCLEPTHKSLFDGTLQGVQRTDCPAFGFQGHPEASPGPHDCAYLFDQFIDAMRSAQAH